MMIHEEESRRQAAGWPARLRRASCGRETTNEYSTPTPEEHSFVASLPTRSRQRRLANPTPHIHHVPHDLYGECSADGRLSEGQYRRTLSPGTREKSLTLRVTRGASSSVAAVAMSRSIVATSRFE